MAAQLPEAEATLAMAPPAEPVAFRRGWTRSLDLVIPGAMIAVILLLCFVWPLFGTVPKPTGGNTFAVYRVRTATGGKTYTLPILVRR